MLIEPLAAHERYRAYEIRVEEVGYHWKDCLTLLFVLHGEIQVTIDNETHSRSENEVDIINPGELRALRGNGDNRVLVLEIRPDFFVDYYEEAPLTYYYVDDRDRDAADEKYEELRLLMAALAMEYLQPQEDSAAVSKERLIELMYHLLNQFHYLYYEQEELREDRVELNRFHRIFSYLDRNFREKVSLQEVAEQEFLNPSYLSYKIKDRLGLTFHDHLNALRCEEGAKLLLESDSSVSEIALDVGFSHPRYFQRHFEEHYGLAPADFREAYTEPVLAFAVLHPSVSRLREVLAGETRYNTQRKPRVLSLDIQTEPIGRFSRSDRIALGEASLLLERENQDLLRQVQREVGFRTAVVDDLFHKEMDIFRGKAGRFFNWTRVEGVLELLVNYGLTPELRCEGVEEYILEDFVNTFEPMFPDVESWLSRTPKEAQNIDPLQDRLEGACDVIRSREAMPTLVDVITSDIELDNDTFFGGSGLFTASYLNKPSFYVWKFLSMMGEEILSEGDGHLITRSEHGVQVLLYRDRREQSASVTCNLFGMEEDMWMSSFLLDAGHGSIYDAWTDLGEPERLDTEHWHLLDRYVHPEMAFSLAKHEIVFALRRQLDLPSVALYLFKNSENG